MGHTNPPDDELRALLAGAGTIALVGATSKPDRPAYEVMQFLLERGFHVVPVTPKETEVLGQRAYPSLAAVPGPVDIVDVFRRAEHAPAIADEAAAIGANTLWLQLGISSEEAAERARAAGMTVVMNRCIAQTTQRFGIDRRATGAP